FWSDRFRRLKESPVADLQYLTFYMAAHLTGQIQAGIRLIHGVAFRTGEVNKMPTVSQHLSTAWLFTCFICQMRRRNCGARCYCIAADVGINQAHSHILGQRIESPFRRSVSSAAEGAGAIDGRNV